MNGKDVVYIDADEEITGIIDKLRSSDKKLVALVLPKRAAMLQSSVNMKLLKKAAEDAKKHLVLVTTESSLLPLAGSVGLYVARNLDSKPEIPALGNAASPLDELVTAEDSGPEDFSAEEAAEQPVGQLAELPEEEPKPSTASAKKVKPELAPRPIPRASDAEDETIELDNSLPEADLAAAAAATDKSAKKDKKSKRNKLKIPNFEKFRLRLILAAALVVVLIVGFILANIVLPKATVTIYTKTSGVNTNLTLNLSTSADKLDATNSTVPAYLQQDKKTESAQVATTGQKNIGTQAAGAVNMTAEVCNSLSQPQDVPAGTGLTANGLTFITQQGTSFSFSQISGGCIVYQGNSSTPITAQAGGTQYNLSNATFSVANRSDVSASGSTNGGTDNVVQVVSQADIQGAQSKIGKVDTGPIKSSLESSLKQNGYYPITQTFNASSPKVSSNVGVGDQSSSVTVTETINYTMFGAHQSDLGSLIKGSVDGQIDTSKQAIVDDGLGSANFSVVSQSGSGAQVNMQVTSSVGPNINQAQLKKQIAGKKSGDAQNAIQNIPGVTKVTVHLSPFWVGSVPKNSSKVTITVKKS